MYYTPQSPQGRPIELIEGNPATIENRGFQIEIIGGQMRDSAKLLEEIKTHAADQQGKAIKDLRDTIGDSYETLYQAADLYEPVGPVIKKYGSELSWIKPLLNNSAERCGELWQTYVSQLDGPVPIGAGGPIEPESSSDDSDEQAEKDAAKKAAFKDWKDEAEVFDVYYGTWEDAFDEAVAGVTDGTSDAIKDGFWRTAFDFASKVLSWAALVAGIAALIFTGPFAAIALGLAAAYLAVTLVQYGYGDADGGDVAWAIVGVLPLGKAGSLFQKGGGKALAGAAKGATRRGLSKAGTAMKHPIQAGKTGVRKAGEAIHTGATKVVKTGKDVGKTIAHPRQAFREANPMGFPDVMIRVETGTSATGWSKAAEGWGKLGGPGRGAMAAVTEVGASQVARVHGAIGHYNLVHDAVTGN